jgi:DNA repair protein RadC
MKDLAVKSWSIGDRSRDKLLLKGKENLLDAELMAVLLGAGNRKESVVALSQRILRSVNGNFNELVKLSIEQLNAYIK